jgi:hypothetical protein
MMKWDKSPKEVIHSPDDGFPTYGLHVYDLAAFELLAMMRQKIISSGNQKLIRELSRFDFLKEEENSLIMAMLQYGFEIPKDKRNFIVPPWLRPHSIFFLGWKLLTVDVHKIEAVLSYQFEVFSSDEFYQGDFSGMVEYGVYSFVKERLFPNEEVRLEKIMAWVERNRQFIREQVDETIIAPVFRVIEMDLEFSHDLYENFKAYFSFQQHEILYQVIVDRELIEGLCFNGNINTLVELFKRLRYNKRIIVKSNKVLNQWINKVFCIRDEKGDLRKLKPGTVESVMKKPKNEPAKGNRILENLAPYIPPAKRKV